jgi:hypothetical protein
MLESTRAPAKNESTSKPARTDVPPQRAAVKSVLSKREWRSALALAEAIAPGGGRVRRADERTIEALEALLTHTYPHLTKAWATAAVTLDNLAFVSTGHRFRKLDHARQQALLQKWSGDPLMKTVLQVFSAPIKMVHFDRQEVYEALGGKLNVVKNLEPARWLNSVIDANNYPARDSSGRATDEEDVECDVVVVGTGAGGAVVGRELAERGHAVVFVEEGKLVRRDEFTGSSMKAHQEFYRASFSIGNSVIPLFIGRLVGGSTAVNGGTTFRTPSWVLDRWCEEMRSDAFTPEHMDPYFKRVEEILQVTPANKKFVGKIQEVFQEGCDAHGWSHFVIPRNAPGCEGTGFCDFGCRTDARRSTNISYIPPALEKGAMLFTKMKAERILIENGRAVGVEGAASESGKKIRVRGRAVVFAGGAIPTPVFLQKQGICNSSGELGKNLTLHPSGGLCAQFDREIRGWDAIPQGYGCDEFLKEGILLTAAQPDFNYAAIVFPFVGDPLMEALNGLQHYANFGILIADQTKGRVLAERDGTTALLYNLTKKDVARYHHGVVKMGEIALAAGAKRLIPAYLGNHDYRSAKEWKRFAERTPPAGDLLLTSYHPLGTCKMGPDPKTSVVDLDHETHDVKGLFIVDASVVSGPLGVNPQLTIMAVATRAAARIHEKLS